MAPRRLLARENRGMRFSSSAAAALAVVLALGLAPAAQAETWTHKDRTGDGTGQSADESTWPVPDDQPEADIARLTVKHRRHKLVVRIDYAKALPEQLPQRFWMAVRVPIKTPAGHWSVEASLDRKGRSSVSWARGARDHRPGCPGLTHTREVGKRWQKITVPTRCIDRADWVRVGAVSWTGGFDERYTHWDDAQRGYHKFETAPKMSPAVYVGKR